MKYERLQLFSQKWFPERVTLFSWKGAPKGHPLRARKIARGRVKDLSFSTTRTVHRDPRCGPLTVVPPSWPPLDHQLTPLARHCVSATIRMGTIEVVQKQREPGSETHNLSDRDPPGCMNQSCTPTCVYKISRSKGGINSCSSREISFLISRPARTDSCPTIGERNGRDQKESSLTSRRKRTHRIFSFRVHKNGDGPSRLRMNLVENCEMLGGFQIISKRACQLVKSH